MKLNRLLTYFLDFNKKKYNFFSISRDLRRQKWDENKNLWNDDRNFNEINRENKFLVLLKLETEFFAAKRSPGGVVPINLMCQQICFPKLWKKVLDKCQYWRWRHRG